MGPRGARNRATRTDDAHDGGPGVVLGREVPAAAGEGVAEQLGVCNATVYRLVEAGELPHVRIVNSIRVRPDDLEEFLRKQLIATTDREG